MATEMIGSVRSGSAKSYDVKWDSHGGEVYVSYAGWSRCGAADSAAQAMRVAEAWLSGK